MKSAFFLLTITTLIALAAIARANIPPIPEISSSESDELKKERERLIRERVDLKAKIKFQNDQSATEGSPEAAELEREQMRLQGLWDKHNEAVLQLTKRTKEGAAVPPDPNDLRFLFPSINPRDWLGPTNPNEPLINPLREPERYKAWVEADQKRLNAALAEKVKGLADFEKDPKIAAQINEKRSLVVAKMMSAEGGAATKALKDMQQEMEKLRVETHSADFGELSRLEKSDSELAGKIAVARKRILENKEKTQQSVWAEAIAEMLQQVQKITEQR